MSNRAGRIAREAGPPRKREGFPLWNGPAPDAVNAVITGGNRDERRRMARARERQQRHERKWLVRTPLQESMIPPGSVISDGMLTDIKAGRYDLALNTRPRPPSENRTAIRAKLKAARAARKRNRRVAA